MKRRRCGVRGVLSNRHYFMPQRYGRPCHRYSAEHSHSLNQGRSLNMNLTDASNADSLACIVTIMSCSKVSVFWSHLH